MSKPCPCVRCEGKRIDPAIAGGRGWPAAVLAVVMAAPPVLADDWPSFQNAGRVSLDSGSNSAVAVDCGAPVWSVSLPGSGQSSPVVQGGRVYVTSASGREKETCHVAAYALTNGEKLWQFVAPNPAPVLDEGYVSRAAPTPAADERGVVCFFEGGLVVALTPEGEVRWRRDLVSDYGAIESRHGLSASVEQTDQLAFVWVERTAEPYLLALDKESGETRWKVEGVGATSWSSPRLVPVANGPHLVLSAIGSLAGFDPATGERLWTLDGLSGNSTPTPVPLGDGKLLIGATDGRGESDAGDNAATNGVVAIRQGSDGKWSAAYQWNAEKATCSFGSPIAHRGVAYFVNRTGVVYAFDVETGKLLYTERGPASVWATPVGIDQSVLLFCKSGQIAAIDAGSQFGLHSFSEAASSGGPEAGAPAGADAERPRTLYGAAVGPDYVIVREGDRLRRLRLTRVD